MSIILFLPMSFIGFLIPFPPVIFGASLAWWVLMVALAGLLLIFFLGPRFSTVRLKPKKAILDSFDRANIVVAVALFTLAYIIAGLVEVATAIDLGIIVPFFRILNPPQRILLFVSFIPFFLVYFFVEGLYLHEFQKWPVENSGFHSELVAAFKVIGVKIIPYVALLLLQYSTLALFSFKLLSGFTGLLIEFLWLIVPVFTISTACSWWFYRNTSTIGLGVIFNSLLFAWISAGLFPF